MKSIPSTVLRAFRSVFALFLSLLSVVSFAQSRKETVGGAALSFEVEKEYGRFLSLSVEEEVRLTGSGPGFDRSVTAVGADYAFINRRLKIGAHYAFQYLYNKDDLYEPRHRVYLNVLYRQAFAPFTLSWRGRLQSTLRDENRSSYRINPKHVMKNRIRAEYEI
ncbi:MAG: DUF2490 domain-containing protein, partial [Tannerella sp.]|nr:DUF2490 domain-containing protein [Tannerella sp.]